MSSSEKWFTCTPVHFRGDVGFFARDSGLMSCGFHELGIESRAVMPGPAMADDDTRLIRTDYKNLEDPAWWESHLLDGVVLYSWADPKYTKVARAIKDAGIFLVINIDSSGVLSFWTDGLLYIKIRLNYSIAQHGRIMGSLYSVCALLRSFLPWTVDLPRLRHMQLANIIGAVTPMARGRMSRYATRFGFPDVAEKIKLIHHPVSSYTAYQGEAKNNLIVALGRWTKNDLVKRPYLLMKLVRRFLAENKEYRVEIIGNYDRILTDGITRLPAEHQSRVKLHGLLPNAEVAKVLVHAKISLCMSANESFHIASAEALCAGCSVVGLSSPLIPFLLHLEDSKCATLASHDDIDCYLHALHRETQLWQTEARNPFAISEMWRSRLHAKFVASAILKESRHIP